METFAPFQYYLFLACAALFGAGLLLALLLPYRRKATEAVKESRTFLALSLAYLVCNTLELVSPTEEATLFFASSGYAFIGGIPVAIFLFAVRFSGHEAIATRLRFLQWAIPVGQLAVVFTNGAHRLHWVSWTFVRVGPFLSMRATGYGAAFWIMYAYLQAFALAGIALLCAAALSRSRAFNRQMLIVLVGALIPWVGNAVYVLRLIPDLAKDFTPVFYAVSAILFAVASQYDRLFGLIPIARSALVEVLADPLVAVDGAGRIIDSNPAARAVCALPQNPAGMPVESNRFLFSVTETLARSGTSLTEASPDGERWYEVRATDVRAGDRALRLFSMRDITERRRLLEEKSELIERLSAALSDIRTLEGIVPICVSCKKVRDDSGYWEQVESYVSSHTMAEFSHGICPDCTARLYPELDASAKEEADPQAGP